MIPKIPEQYRYYPNDNKSEIVTTKVTRGGVTETIKTTLVATCPICGTKAPGWYYLNQGTGQFTSCHNCREAEQANVWIEHDEKMRAEQAKRDAEQAERDKENAAKQAVIDRQKLLDEIKAAEDKAAELKAKLSNVSNIVEPALQQAMDAMETGYAIGVAKDIVQSTLQPPNEAVLQLEAEQKAAIEDRYGLSPQVDVPNVTEPITIPDAWISTEPSVNVPDKLATVTPAAKDLVAAAKAKERDANVKHVNVPKGGKFEYQKEPPLQIRQ